MNRIPVLDILRGFALFGILIVNVRSFSSPEIYNSLLRDNQYAGVADTAVYWVIGAFVQGKFYTMFSFLFGYGFILFMNRAADRTGRNAVQYVRRLIFLAISGVLHGFFLWWGDVLLVYALTGLLLLFFIRARANTCLAWAIGLIAFYVVFVLLVYWSGPGVSNISSEELALYESRVQESLQVYPYGNFADIIQQTQRDRMFMAGQDPVFGLFFVLPMFLLGVYSAKRRLLEQAVEHTALLRRVRNAAVAAGIVLTGCKLIGMYGMDANVFSGYDVLYSIGAAVGDPIVSIFYIASIALIVAVPRTGPLLRALACTGRMSLTNYFMQTLIAVFIFYGYGFGLYGHIGPAIGLLFSCAVFTLQLFLSSMWIRRYRRGPLEYLWRMFTYGRSFCIPVRTVR